MAFLIGVVLPKQKGNTPVRSFLSADRDDIVIDAFKSAQDGDGCILRLYEASQKRGDVTVTVDLPFTRVTECNLMEENEQEIPTENGAFRFAIRPFEVKTFRLR